jgi:branched-chain amino acid aminotransferase
METMGFNGKYYLQGDVLHECRDASFENIHRDTNVYEVIRVIDGIPLFLEKHCTRLRKSAQYIGINFSIDEIVAHKLIKKLVLKNNILNGNLKIVLKYPGSSDKLFLFFIPHHYPSAEDYKKGIDMLSLSAERDNPMAKVSNPELRARADQLINEQGVTEVLLVDKAGFITEGSRSNIFLVREKTIFTPTIESVLPGITRETIIEICRSNGIELQECKIKLSELGAFHGTFITGTSPKVLPVRKIDNYGFDVKALIIREIMEKYNRAILDYLSGF